MQAASRRRTDLGRIVLLGLAGVLLLAAPLISLGLTIRERTADASDDHQSISQLQARVKSLEGQIQAHTNWGAIAREVQSSIFTVATKSGLGSGWVARSGIGGSELVTNFHVVAEAWNAGEVRVQVRQGDRTLEGTITRVQPGDDLATVHIADRFPPLPTAGQRPQLGDAVLAVGSPLGLGGSVSLGVVSGFRSLEGADYIQFSAPVSPGNSGGPVLDGQGRVIAITSAKFEGRGVEALSLAIPVQTACATVVTCTTLPSPVYGGG
jgi:putative serine protease PepD